MELILLEKIENLGVLGDVVDVKNGYARNYLLPQGKAMIASDEAKTEFESRRAELEAQAADALTRAKGRGEQLDGTTITVAAKASDEGKLFGSVSQIEIMDALEAAGTLVEKREIRLPEGPIRATGEHVVGLHLHADVDVSINVIVEAEA